MKQRCNESETFNININNYLHEDHYIKKTLLMLTALFSCVFVTHQHLHLTKSSLPAYQTNELLNAQQISSSHAC